MHTARSLPNRAKRASQKYPNPASSMRCTGDRRRPRGDARNRRQHQKFRSIAAAKNIAVAAIFYEEWKWTLLWKLLLLLLLMSPKLQPRIPLQEQYHERTVATEVVQLSLNSLTVMPNCSLAFCYVIMQPSTPRLPRTRLQTTSAHAIPT